MWVQKAAKEESKRRFEEETGSSVQKATEKAVSDMFFGGFNEGI